ncbi:HTH domain-containing protein [Natronolimnohabitans innermongolicus]|uniref:Uncharacterized protein n=1 Tax=Natronolimnohabitans innermongolicus JCM 12255 TaxID=1227499 RepID=L9WUV3_9EURY|nr:HTH domain-containing protein [Natronolimnohabitans innermongolicus]ELY52113.1 hypothetical protein C493_16589 [Natronolimnohabitans innermongolicus JCM 12255]
MPATNRTTPAVDLESEATLRIDCYVRQSVPTALTDTINDIIDRLGRLQDAGEIHDYDITYWPPECHAVDVTDDTRPQTRDELVTAFERWAVQQGHSLEPAFRRREIPASSFGVGPDEPRERVRVPVVTLAVREVDPDADADTDADADEPTLESLRGVVPYTEQSHATESRTYTVDEWLRIVEPNEDGAASRATPHEQPMALEGHQ